jgi:predicted ATPase
MIRDLQIKNFKSWQDTGKIKFSGITGFFGANSSGKSSLLQFLLLLKQSVEDRDRYRSMFLGDEKSLVNLGSYESLIHQHDIDNQLEFSIRWDTNLKLSFENHKYSSKSIKKSAVFQAKKTADLPPEVIVQSFDYEFGRLRIGIHKERAYQEIENGRSSFMNQLDEIDESYIFTMNSLNIGKGIGVPAPDKFYRFPEELFINYKIPIEISKLPFQFDDLFRNMFYLGPLRESPKAVYSWSGGTTSGVGSKGENAIPALLSARYTHNKSLNIEQKVANALKKMGLILDFRIQTIGNNSKEYEVLLKPSKESVEVSLNNVGFGISQILPVVILCYTVPENSILLLEQPELHLHPAIQYNLADLFIDVVKERNLQIVFESHSEYLLMRLQLRIAEEKISNNDSAIYFTRTREGQSKITRLKVDTYGDINNWPDDFFGDMMAEVSKRTLKSIEREEKDRQ